MSLPDNPNEVGFFDTPGWAYDVVLVGNLAYVADELSGLRIIDVSTPENPTEVGFIDTPGSARGVTVVETHAYVADYSAGLRIIDVSQPTAPVEVGFYDTAEEAVSVAVVDNLAYIADSRDGIRIVDVGLRRLPFEWGFYDTPGFARSVVVDGDYTYVADYGGGLITLDYTYPLITHLSFIGKSPPADMSFVPAGEFRMGCTSGGFYDAFPTEIQHKVFLNAFFIDKFEVTNAKYAQCVAAGVCLAPAAYSSHSRASYYDNPTYNNYPVMHITWDDALDYCLWAGKRLPTEAEWEKAALGSLGYAQYPWGDEAPVCGIGAPNGAQYDMCSPDDTIGVGSFGPNTYGLYDLAGNVWEYASDWWDSTYYSFSPYENPQGPEEGTYKVMRGGSWNYNLTGLSVTYRNYDANPNNLGNHDVGFRCVLAP